MIKSHEDSHLSFHQRAVYTCGSHYLIADVGKIERLTGMGMHSHRVPAFVLPDRCSHARGLDPTVERFLAGGKQQKHGAR